MPRRTLRVVPLIALLLATTVLMSACSGTAESGAQSASGGGSGMGMGSGGPTEGPEMGLGVIAAEGEAEMDLADESTSLKGVAVDRVVSPEAGWVVVVSLDAPGGILGKVRVPAGESEDVIVPLDTADASKVRVRLHADGGRSSVFEYDPNRPSRSSDKPVFVEGDPIEGDITLTAYGVEAPQNLGSMLVQDQRLGGDGAVLVDYVRLPGPSWIAIHVMENNVPGRLVGWVQRYEGESFDVQVPIEGASPGEMLMVTIHIDRNNIGDFEYEVEAPLTSIDQPYTANGLIVAKNIRLQ